MSSDLMIVAQILEPGQAPPHAHQLQKAALRRRILQAPAPPAGLKRYVATLAQLQDELGLINDHVTALALVDDALKNRHAGPIQGWMAGRHELLVHELPDALAVWLAQKAPWK